MIGIIGLHRGLLTVRSLSRLLLPKLLLLCLVTAFGVQAEELWGRVVRVSDGDSITVIDAGRKEFRVRLAGIDAPERGQPYNRVARTSLSHLLAGAIVVVQVDKVDRFGRLVGRVQVGGMDASLEQLRAGMAWFYRRYEDDLPPALRSAYAAAEGEARASRSGLWRDAEPVPPWVWRRR
ncbi:MAG TPA: hypothetical protein DCY89_04445 [Gammaproteobacteria bacterium]|nr:hypothetical protein [Gammaproteobacteria bacterium]